MNFDIGLPLEQTMPLLRGKQIVCRVKVSPMTGPEADVRGAIVVVLEDLEAKDPV